MSPGEAGDMARQLQASEARFRRIFEDSPISLQIIARDGRTLRVNRAWALLMEVPEEALEPFLYKTYNIFEDPYLRAHGITDLIRRTFAGESFALPPVYYDPAEIGRPGRARWMEVYLYPIKNAEGVIDEIVLMHDDVTEQKHAEATLRFLAETSSALLATALNYEATLTRVAELAMRQFGGWCAIHMVEAAQVHLGAVAHLEQDKADELRRLWQDVRPLEELGCGPLRVIRTGEPELHREFADILKSGTRQASAEDAPEQLAGVRVKSCLSVPLRQRSEMIGALTLLSADRFYSSEDLALAQELADRAALALQNARLYDQSQQAIQAHKLLANTMLQGVVHRDFNGTVISMNPAAERILGRTREEFLGSSCLREEHPAIREDGSPLPGLEHPAMVALREGEPVRGVVMGLLNPREGNYRWISVDAVPLFQSGQEKPYQVYTVFSDITERKHAEEALRQSEGRFRIMADSSPIMMWVTDREGGLRYVNRTCREFFGATLEQVERGKWRPLVHPDDTPQLTDAFLGAVREHRSFIAQARVRRADGQWRWVASHAEPRFSSSGEFLGHVGVSPDITESKRAEDALREREARLASIYDAVTDVIFLLAVEGDDNYRFESINHAFSETTGLPPETILGRRVDEVIPEPSLALVRDRYREAIKTGKTVRWHETTRYPTGLLVGDVAVTPLVAPDGRVTHLVGAVHDITERERVRDANEQLLEADRRKNEFLAMLSHELRNPLAPIMNCLFILDRVVPGGDQARRAQAVLTRQTNQLARLVNDLMDVTRISRNKIQLQRQRLELNELVQRTIDDHRSVFEKAGVLLGSEPAPTSVFVNADRNRLVQAIGNLLQNAAKFTPPEGHVLVTVSTDGAARQAVIRVRDTGMGLDPEMAAHLFEPFVQADRTLDRSKGGLGLGLALVKGLVHLHDGEVDASSAGLGKGSEFIIRLPLDLTAPVSAEREPTPAVRVRRRVLVIEDNLDAARSLREVLELDGHEVALAANGGDGIAKAREFHPDFVFCDIGLPVMDGYAVARAFRMDKELRDVRLVAVSGYALPKDSRRAAEVGFEHYLAKPATLEKLRRVLDSVPAPSSSLALGRSLVGEEDPAMLFTEPHLPK